MKNALGFKMIRKLLVLSLAFTACTSKKRSDAVIPKARQTSTASDDSMRLIDAGIKGHLLGALMSALAKNQQQTSGSKLRPGPSAGHPEFLDLESQIPQTLTVIGLESYATNLAFAEAAQIKKFSRSYWEAKAKEPPHGPSAIYLDEYRQKLFDNEGILEIESNALPFKCTYLPNGNVPLASWSECIDGSMVQSDSGMMANASYGASIAQALFIKEWIPSADAVRAYGQDRPRVRQTLDRVKDDVNRQDHDRLLSTEERETFARHWHEITNQASANEAEATGHALTFLGDLLARFTLSDLEDLLAQELSTLSKIADFEREDQRLSFVGQEGRRLSHAELDEYQKRVEFTLAVSSEVRLSVQDMINLQNEVRSNPELDPAEKDFAKTLAGQLLAVWNGQASVERALSTSLDRLPESHLKTLMREKLSRATKPNYFENVPKR